MRTRIGDGHERIGWERVPRPRRCYRCKCRRTPRRWRCRDSSQPRPARRAGAVGQTHLAARHECRPPTPDGAWACLLKRLRGVGQDAVQRGPPFLPHVNRIVTASTRRPFNLDRRPLTSATYAPVRRSSAAVNANASGGQSGTQSDAVSAPRNRSQSATPPSTSVRSERPGAVAETLGLDGAVARGAMCPLTLSQASNEQRQADWRRGHGTLSARARGSGSSSMRIRSL